jgi:hypothetical protein
MDNQMAESVTAFSILALSGWGFYLFFRRYQITIQLQQQRIESFNRMIEKFGTAKEFIEFTQTPQGKKLLDEPVGAKPNPLNKVLRFIQAGVLFIMIGFGYYLNGMRMADVTEVPMAFDRMNAYYWGALSTCLGIGLLIVAAITFIFVRRWHLANGESKQ